MGRPATGKTPGHSVRVPQTIWDEASARVGEGKMSELIVKLLEKDNAAVRRRAKAAERDGG